MVESSTLTSQTLSLGLIEARSNSLAGRASRATSQTLSLGLIEAPEKAPN